MPNDDAVEWVSSIYECNSCDWIGYEWDCACFKHLPEQPLCPECHETVVRVTPERVKELMREIKYLRHYGNKDCTAMADEAMNRGDLDN